MKLKSLFFAAAASVAVSAANADQRIEKYVNGSNEFGLQVFKSMAQDQDNVLYSPAGINSVISMVGHFSAPKHQEVLLKAMKIQGLSIQDYNYAVKAVTESLVQSATPEYKMTVANSFWVTKEFAVKNSTQVTDAANIYNLTFFKNHSFAEAKTADAMNSWVKKETKERIKELVTAADVAPLQWAAINAVYFDGKWFEKFGRSFSDEPFTTPDGKDVEVAYMEAAPGDGVNMLADKDYNLFELAYGKSNGNAAVEHKGSMYIVQPKNPAKFKELVQSLTVAKFNQVIKAFADQRALGNMSYVSVNIPTFELSFETDMKPVANALIAGGAKEFFTGFDMTALNPQFSIANENKIKLIKQKANITVANKGTVAAAASFAGGGIESMGPQTVTINSAFAYFIVDNETKAILFAGTLTNPKDVTVPEIQD